VLPGSAAERAAEIAGLHARALALREWPESLRREPYEPVDHVEVFGLAGLPAAVGEVSGLAAGGVVSGELVAAAGPDLHLATGRGVVVLDTRLMTGWELVPAGGTGVQAGGAGGAGGVVLTPVPAVREGQDLDPVWIPFGKPMDSARPRDRWWVT
jgi:hypothetical protein